MIFKLRYYLKLILPLSLIFFLGAFVRFFLSPLGFHVDIFSTAAWGEWIYKNNPKDFYEHNIWLYSWPTQPPLVNLVYDFSYWLYQQLVNLFSQIAYFIAINRLAPTKFLWFFDFVKWFGTIRLFETSFNFGYLIIIKLLPILADLLIAIIIYLLAKSLTKTRAILLSAIYLFSPFSFYLSSLWGQYDGVGFLFLILAFISFLSKFSFLSWGLLLLSVGLKPTALIFVPLFIWIFFKQIKQKQKLPTQALNLLIGILVFLIPILIFANKDLLGFINDVLIPKIFYKAEFRLSTNSFNFWHIFIGNRAYGQDYSFIFIPARIWGYGIFLLINLLALKVLKKISLENIFVALFLISFGGWLFLTNMLERYAFAGIVTLLFVSIYKPFLLKYWIILSIIFWLNLYHGWWFPHWLEPLHQILIWQDGLITRLLSVINVIFFFQLIKVAEDQQNS